MKVEIWSDFVCPFCYIGKRKFEAALEQFAHKEHVVTEFRSFELDRNTSSEAGMTTYEMLASKYGMSLEQAAKMSAGVAEQAAAAGLQFRFDGMLSLNTFDAHRLSHYAAAQGKSNEMTERLFKAYFTDNDNISDHHRLAELAAETGMDGDDALAILQSDQYRDAVRSHEDEGSRLGIQGVPFFVVDRKYAVSGAQSPAVFLDTLNKAWEEKHPGLVQVAGDSGAVCEDGTCVPNDRNDKQTDAGRQ